MYSLCFKLVSQRAAIITVRLKCYVLYVYYTLTSLHTCAKLYFCHLRYILPFLEFERHKSDLLEVFENHKVVFKVLGSSVI